MMTGEVAWAPPSGPGLGREADRKRWAAAVIAPELKNRKDIAGKVAYVLPILAQLPAPIVRSAGPGACLVQDAARAMSAFVHRGQAPVRPGSGISNGQEHELAIQRAQIVIPGGRFEAVAKDGLRLMECHGPPTLSRSS